MRVNWEHRFGYPVANVEHQLAKEVLVAWPALEMRLMEQFDLDMSQGVLNGLVKIFIGGSDVRSARISGDKLVSVALCPASAWLMNHYLDVMLQEFAKHPSLLKGDILRAIEKFGFKMRLSHPKENGFLKAARVAGFDVIRTSKSYPTYIIRDLAGNSISVMQQFTDRTSHIATQTSTNKLLAAEILHLAGLPTPTTFSVSSARHAVEVFKREGLSMAVIKPCNTDRGVGVHTGLKTDVELSTAFDAASKYGKVILQEHTLGDDFRILVVDGEVMGVTHRKPFMIVGDGIKTVRELVNDKITWRSSHPFYRNFNNISSGSSDIRAMLQRQSLDYSSVLDKGRAVKLRSNANVSSGGEHEDVTSQCHPDVKQLALDCAALFGLDVAGIDYLSADITESWKGTGGTVCEVNPTPAMSVDGVPQKVFSRFVNYSNDLEEAKRVGDIIYINDCSCKSLENLEAKFIDFNFLDLTRITEVQYFFQSFLRTRAGRFICVVPSALLNRYGLVNSNVRKIFVCNKCKADVEEVKNFLKGAHDFEVEFLI